MRILFLHFRLKNRETPMQRPPAEIRDRLLTGLDQDYNVSGVCGGPSETADLAAAATPGDLAGTARDPRGPEGTSGDPRAPPGTQRVPPRPPGGRASPVSSGLFSVLKFSVQSVRVCSPCPLSSRLRQRAGWRARRAPRPPPAPPIGGGECGRRRQCNVAAAAAAPSALSALSTGLPGNLPYPHHSQSGGGGSQIDKAPTPSRSCPPSKWKERDSGGALSIWLPPPLPWPRGG